MIKIEKFLLFLISIVCIILFSAIAFGADINGYTSKYEADIGIPGQCDQVIQPGDAWSTINWNNKYICIAAGDHTSKGKLIVGGSGTSSNNRKWIMLEGSDSNFVNPVKLSRSAQAIIKKIETITRDWVVVHRVTLIPGTGGAVNLKGCDDCVIDNILIDGEGRSNDLIGFKENTQRSTLQNSVVRNTDKFTNRDTTCVAFRGTDNRIVNNEIYNCAGDGIVFDTNSKPYGSKVENNDIYQTDDYLIGCDGKPGTDCNCGEDGMDIKDGGTSSLPIEFIHNRVSGWRTTYETCGGTGSVGWGVNSGDRRNRKSYVLVKDNIIWSVSNGVQPGGQEDHWTVEGNLIFDVIHAHQAQDRGTTGGAEDSIAIVTSGGNNHEIYFNTIIDSEIGLRISTGTSNTDIKGNTFINIQKLRYNSLELGSGSVADYNAFYNTNEMYSTGVNNINKPSASDAKHEPFCFYWKLITGPELKCIDNAIPTPSSPHYKWVPSSFADRTNRGINNDKGFTGIHKFDWNGNVREGTTAFAEPSTGQVTPPPPATQPGPTPPSPTTPPPPAPSPIPPPSGNTYNIEKLSIKPTIDGNCAEYQTAQVIQLFSGLKNHAGKYKLAWDNTALYVCGDVIDSELNTIAINRDDSIWQDDSVEIMFDTLNNKGTSQGNDDYKFFVNVNNLQQDNKALARSWNMVFGSAVTVTGTINNNADTDQGYAVEIEIPWANWGIPIPSPDSIWGFEIVFNDRDALGNRNKGVWSNSITAGLNDPDGFGSLIFKDSMLTVENPLKPLDLNTDNKINLQDLLIIVKNFKKTNFDQLADVNKDGIVDLFDLVMVARHFGTTIS